MKFQQLESDKRHTELQKQASELEMQALRAQMNPHFIFNCLNSIQHFIILNDEISASKYLTKFSMLMRKFLEHSKSNIVTLQEEVELLRLYIELEALRSKNKFNFYLKIAPNIDIFNIEIPSMLFQPFVENAITHGLLNLQRRGTLILSFELEDGYLTGRIEDDGVGRKKAGEIQTSAYKDHASRGMEIINERISVLNYIENVKIELEIIDKVTDGNKSGGTSVIIKIPV
jgi:LytS/YehU family sensor histidine kinase